ncbi:MAG: DUF1579 domain-containing protein [Phycisphaeraceae bacterium]|nr:DUF1579 domain-containing protein [Phycisphaeraceae bacterium]
MKRASKIAVIGCATLAAMAIAFTRGDQPEMPPGMTPERAAMMEKCMLAAQPGKMHAFLAEGAGVWDGRTKMWMMPDSAPIESTCVSTVTVIMDGRFVKCDIVGEMPGMGAFVGSGFYGYNNVTGEFESTWIDNCSTGIMRGTGRLSSDNKKLTWKSNYTCPVTSKPCVVREIETITGKNTRTLEMYGVDPLTGVEYKMMEIAFTRRVGAEQAGAGTR